MLGEAYIGKGLCKEALAQFDRSRVLGIDVPYVLGHLGYLHARCGDRGEALKLLRQLEQRRPPPEVDVARIHAGLGHNDQAFACLDRAAAGRYSQLVFLRGAVALGELRSDPRFDWLLFETMGLPHKSTVKPASYVSNPCSYPSVPFPRP